jgi:hypothetical protein
MPIDNDVIVYSTEHGDLRKPPRSAPEDDPERHDEKDACALEGYKAPQRDKRDRAAGVSPPF